MQRLKQFRKDQPLSLAEREAWYFLVFSRVLVLFKCCCVCYTHTCLILLYFSFSDFLHENQTGNSAASVNFLLVSSSLASHNRLYFISFNSMNLRDKLSVFPSSTAPLMQLAQPFPKVGSILPYWKEWVWCSHKKKSNVCGFCAQCKQIYCSKILNWLPLTTLPISLKSCSKLYSGPLQHDWRAIYALCLICVSM